MSHPDAIAGYAVQAVLGYGAHSTIYVVRGSDDKLYALKHVVRREPEDQRFIDQTINEFEVASKLDHPAIRKCYDIKKQRKLLKITEVNMVMELVDGYSLVQQQPQTMSGLVQVFLSVAEALHAMHKQGFVHADMKPNNVIVAEHNRIKLIDLGQSCPVGTVKERIQGTPDYIAPEQVNREPLHPVTDVFNFGATMYWCVTGQHVPTLIPKEMPSGKPADVDNALNTRDLHGPTAAPRPVRPPIEFNQELPMALNMLIMHCVKHHAYERPQSMIEVHARLKIALKQVGNKWDKRELVDAFKAAYEAKEMEKATQLLQEMDSYLSPEEAAPYMPIAREVLAWAKTTFGNRFKAAIQARDWATASKMGGKIIKAFPNSSYAGEVRQMMGRIKREAQKQQNPSPASSATA